MKKLTLFTIAILLTGLCFGQPLISYHVDSNVIDANTGYEYPECWVMTEATPDGADTMKSSYNAGAFPVYRNYLVYRLDLTKDYIKDSIPRPGASVNKIVKVVRSVTDTTIHTEFKDYIGCYAVVTGSGYVYYDRLGRSGTLPITDPFPIWGVRMKNGTITGYEFNDFSTGFTEMLKTSIGTDEITIIPDPAGNTRE